jgi:peptide/nickel transport system substrate-binding protein
LKNLRSLSPLFSQSISSASLFVCVFCALLTVAGCTGRTSADPGVVNFVIETMPTNLDPRIGTDAQSARLDSLIFSGLISLDAQGVAQPDLAEKWEMPDPLTYVFHLRPGVKFHDGTPLTSVDVKYTFDSILDGSVSSPKRGSFSQVDRIETPDQQTVIFRLKAPYAEFLPSIQRSAIGIVPAGAGKDFLQHPVGTGPFRFVSARQDDDVVLERNADYFAGAPKISRIRFRVVPEAVVRALELRKGSADLEVNSLAPDMIPVLRDQPSLEVTEQPGTNYAYVAFNLDDPILANRDVRQALAEATDRPEIVKYLLRDQARIADGPLPPNSWAYEPDIARYPYDPHAAERLLDAAGFPRGHAAGGMRMKLSLKTSTDESPRLLGEVLREQWGAVGVDLELRPLEFATLFADASNGSFETFTLRWVGANNDPDIFEYIFSSKKMPPLGANRGHYRNAELDSLLDQARIETDMAKRRELLSKVQKIVANDLPYLSLFFMDNVSVHNKRIRNVQLSPSGDYDFLRTIEAR